MVKVIFLSNPFDTDKKTILEAPYVACKTVQGYAKPFVDDYPDTKFHISINGHVLVDEEINVLYPADNDSIVIIPAVEKGALRMVANIALMYFVGSAGFLPNVHGFAKALLQAGAMYVGGRIINAILPPPKLTGPESQNISPTYGWEGAKPIAATGTPIGRTFGTVKPAPVVLARHITTDGDKQYLNILYGGGEGPIDRIENITIEGNPIANYKDVQVDIRLGTNDQEPIPNFGDTFADQSLNYELLSDSWATQQTEGNAGEGLELTVELPGGLYHVKNDGGLENATVKIKAQFRKVGAAGWTDWPLINDGTVIAAKNTAVRRVYRMDGLEPARYEVHCQCYYKSGTDTRYGTRVYWSQLSHIIYNDFARPGKVLVGIKALATDQLSGSDPDVGWTQARDNANVWNPNTAKYEQKPLTNPYWACYDMIHNCKYLKNINTGQYEYVVEGNPVSRIDYPTFAENAAYSAELDSVGDPRFELNMYIDTNISFWDALARLAVVGRGVIIPKGTKYSCICDKPAVPTQMFTMGNITEKSLKGKFQSTKDRSQSIEVEFYNRIKDYKQDLAVYYGDDWDNTARVPNPTKVTRYGITKYKYAYREAVFLYKGNKYLKRTENWEADIDAIACKPGDVVLLQHDVPKWGLAGGRIISATENTVTIDKDVVLDEGKTYAIEIRLLDDSRVNRTVQSANGNVLALITPFTDIPQKYDVYAFGESNKVTKPFKIINIVKSKDLQCKLTGIEYIEDMYSDVVDIPVVNYSALDNTLTEVEKISIGQETYTQKDGTVISVIHAGWAVPRNRTVYEYQISYSRDNGLTWTKWDNTKDINIVMSGVKALETYLIKVCTVNELGVVSNGTISDPIYITGKDTPPSDIINLALTQSGNQIIAIIDAANEPDFYEFELREGVYWDSALIIGHFSEKRYVFNAKKNGNTTYLIKAIDNSQNYSDNATSTAINVFGLSEKNILFEQSIPATDEWELTNAVLMGGSISLSAVEKIGDYNHFFDMFGSNYHLKEGAEIVLPSIDLGGDLLEDSSFYVDGSGVMQVLSIETLASYNHFFDMFGGNVHQKPLKYKTETFANMDIVSNAAANIAIKRFYRTSLDNVIWSEYQQLDLNNAFFGRYIQSMVQVTSLDRLTNVSISGAIISIDVPDIEDLIELVFIPAQKTKISYNKRFCSVISTAAYTTDINGKTCSCRITGATNKECYIELLDASGNLIAGNVYQLRVRGY